MMEINTFAFLSFVFITSFTPGPNNLMSASLGMLIGYRKSLRFLFGIVTGFSLLLWMSSFLSGMLLESAPYLEQYLKYFGALYILYLAYGTLKASYSHDGEARNLASFSRGFFLQLVNAKGLVYALTIFTTFLSGITGNFWSLALINIFLGIVCFTSISTWSLFGTMIQRYMKNARIKLAINAILALALVYTAAKIAGFLD